MRIGYKASSEQFSPVELLRYAVLAEQLGLDSVWVADHFQPWRHTDGHAPHALTWLGAATQATHRVQLGTSVLTPSFRYNPAVLAQAFATLDALSDGRVALGVGSGEALNEIAVGLPQWPPFAERSGRLREAVRLIRALWADERVTFDGDWFHTVDATVYDRPAQPIPVYVAGAGPKMATYAGRVADGFICTSGKGTQLYRDTLLPALDEGLARSGRDRSAIDLLIELKVSYDRDLSVARDACHFWAPLALTAEQKHGTSDPRALEALAASLSAEQVESRWIVTDDPAQVVDIVTQYRDWGFTHVVVHGPGHDQERFLTQFAADVLPVLRAMEGRI